MSLWKIILWGVLVWGVLFLIGNYPLVAVTITALGITILFKIFDGQ